MSTVILLVYMSTFAGNASTGGPFMLNMASVEACHQTAASIKAAVGSKLDWYHCIETKGKT